MKCNGNASQTCGGSGALDVYTSTVRNVVTSPKSTDLATWGAWKYDACASPSLADSRAGPSR